MLNGFRLAGPRRPKIPAIVELPTVLPPPAWLPFAEDPDVENANG
jgi:hypothetical protein